MRELNVGKPYKIYAEVLEEEALQQFESAMQQDYVVRGALMADAHTGYSLPIGGVVATDGVIVPAWAGYDLGCGMCALRTEFNYKKVLSHRQAIFDAIYKVVPTGFKHNERDTRWDKANEIEKSAFLEKVFAVNGLKQLGSLGSGNHFIEIGIGKDNKVWIIVHSGSRNIGHTVATHYMKLASGDGKAREGHFGLRADSAEGIEYIKDLNFCLQFALQNRLEMIKRVERVIQVICVDGLMEANDYSALINRNHNHAELKDGLWIHRKGATHAEEGMLGVIPGNMRDGCFIVRGKGNPESLCSSSHGAGRAMSRKKAREATTMDTFTEQMREVTARVCADTLDESPDSYKNIFNVMDAQKDLIDIVEYVSPVINIKG